MTTTDFILDANTTAKEFNAVLKRMFKEHLKLDVRVRIINSYKFPRCYTEVWLTQADAVIPNEFRLLALKEAYPKVPETDWKCLDNVNAGNIAPKHITLYAHEWNSLWLKFTIAGLTKPSIDDDMPFTE